MLLYRGAEAELTKEEYLGLPAVRKNRLRKIFRNRALDDELRTSRTKNEARMLRKARACIRTPRVLEVGEDEILMEFVEGETLKNAFSKGDVSRAREVGKAIRRLHDAGIVHNDLTTSNIVVGEGLCFVDFGLSFASESVEDKATDLIVFKKMLSSTHYDMFEDIWAEVLQGYSASREMRVRMQSVEDRGRYK
ncbi:MAG: Kae1-associated serine/threonine protein kinase [Candidatus Diapherotrites archaeon]|nr:Kae1-associated serine/threonine protein kinase [Candidatus Diapherotrites archaeon]